MRVEIEAFGDVQVSRRLLRFADRAQDASPAFESIADLLRASERRQFDTQGRYASGGWEPLSEATKAAKRRDPDPTVRANADRVMVATESTMRSLTVEHDDLHVEVVQPHQLVFGTTSPAAKFHQPDRQGRRVIEVRRRDRTEIAKRVQRHLMTGRPT